MSKAHPNHFYLNRALLDSDRWLAEKFTRGQAWVDLCGLAHHKSRTIFVNGVSITVPRGCVAYSQLSLSKRWKWSRKKVAAQMKQWGYHKDITTIKTDATNFWLIQIVKYDFWQGDGATECTTDGTTDDTTEGTQSINDKNVKNEKKQSSDKPKTPTGDKTDHLMPLKIYILAFQKTFASVEHIQDLIRRCVRESKALTAYTPKMIALACLVADDERAASGKQYDITLETVGKKLAQHAAHLPESPQNLSWANELLAKYESMKDTMLSKTSSLISVPTA